MDSYTNPYNGMQPSIPNGGQFTPASMPPQGDIILAPAKKLDKKRILILVGISVAVIALFVIVIMNITSGTSSAPDPAIEGLLRDNYDCIAVLEEQNVRALSKAENAADFFNASVYGRTQECVESLSTISDRIAKSGSWSNDKMTTREFNELKNDLVDFIGIEEEKMIVYTDFYDAYRSENEAFISKYLLSQLSEDEPATSPFTTGDTYQFETAANRLISFFERKKSLAASAEEMFCNVNVTYGDEVCDYYTKNYSSTIKDFNRSTMIAEAITRYFYPEERANSYEMISPRIELIIGVTENE